jgi:hypothetical protein
VIQGSIPGVGTEIYLELIWVPCSLAIETTITQRRWHKVNKNNDNIKNGRYYIIPHEDTVEKEITLKYKKLWLKVQLNQQTFKSIICKILGRKWPSFIFQIITNKPE